MLSTQQVIDFWIKEVGLARLFGKDEGNKEAKKYIKKKKLGHKAVEQQRSKRSQLKQLKGK